MLKYVVNGRYGNCKTAFLNACTLEVEKHNDAWAWTRNNVLGNPEWSTKVGKRQFGGWASLGKWADTSESWNTNLSAAGAWLRKSWQVG